jgi:DNA-binding NarL/FixJ family response regulator
MRTSGQRSAVLLDQYPLWLEAVEPVVRRIGIDVVGKATTPDEALALIEDGRPDVLVMDPRTADGSISGPAVIREARERLPSLKIIVLGTSTERKDIDAVFEAGALAYVFKTAHPEDIASTIRQAFEHSVFFASSSRAGEPANGSTANGSTASGPAAAPKPREAVPGLTRRELEILRLVAEGHSNGQLARMLWVTEQTVKFHLSNIYRKLDVANRTEASRWAQLNGLLPETTAAA